MRLAGMANERERERLAGMANERERDFTSEISRSATVAIASAGLQNEPLCGPARNGWLCRAQQ